MQRRTPLICGNWKMNLGPSAARAHASYLSDRLRGIEGAHDVEVVVFPTALSVSAVADALDGSAIAVGIQEVAAIPSGALTGASSAVMAREAGCTWMLAGHSERRQHFAETDDGVGAKVRVGLAAGLTPIACVGETLPERQAGDVEAVVGRQLTAVLAALDASSFGRLTVAYEPVWAIGTGVTASAAEAQEVHATLRALLRERCGAPTGDAIRILYGGSVNGANAAELLACPDIDGALVGGASLQLEPFAAIVAAAAATASPRRGSSIGSA